MSQGVPPDDTTRKSRWKRLLPKTLKWRIIALVALVVLGGGVARGLKSLGGSDPIVCCAPEPTDTSPAPEPTDSSLEPQPQPNNNGWHPSPAYTEAPSWAGLANGVCSRAINGYHPPKVPASYSYSGYQTFNIGAAENAIANAFASAASGIDALGSPSSMTQEAAQLVEDMSQIAALSRDLVQQYAGEEDIQVINTDEEQRKALGEDVKQLASQFGTDYCSALVTRTLG